MIPLLRPCFLACMVFLFTAQSSFSQTDTDSTKRSDIVRFADGVWYNVSSPVRWKKQGWATAGLVILGDAAVSLADRPVNRFWAGVQKTPTLDAINDFGNWYGLAPASALITGGFYLSGLAFKNQWARETGLILGTALVTSSMFHTALKPLVGRARPVAGDGHYAFHPLSGDDHYHSFPSGHTIMAFTISFVLARRVKSVPLKIFFYSLSTATAFCRLYSNAHWISDVAMGAATAWFSTDGAIRRLSRNKYRKTSLAVIPGIGNITLRLAIR